MRGQVFKALKTRDLELQKACFLTDHDVDHFMYFILRLLRDAAQNPALASQLRVDPSDCMDHQTLVYRMEQAADYATDVARHLIMLSTAQKKRYPMIFVKVMVNAGGLAVDFYTKSVNAFFSKDVPFLLKS